jgi:ubiquinone biosynthesis protein
MSTRGDIFPPEYIEELSKLQDRVPPVPFDDIRKVIEQELGMPLDALFDHIDPNAMAAASVAQVHSARLQSGEKVAVKVIRPGSASASARTSS